MEYAVTVEEEPFGILFEFDLEVCRSVQTESTHQFIPVWFKEQWKINVTLNI